MEIFLLGKSFLHQQAGLNSEVGEDCLICKNSIGSPLEFVSSIARVANRFINKTLLIGFLVIGLSTYSELFSQDLKVHFKIHKLVEQVDTSIYHKALVEYGKLGQFRYLNQRRQILFVDKMVSVEIFSAEELFTKYQKRISPFTIKETAQTFETVFEFDPQGNINVNFIKH